MDNQFNTNMFYRNDKGTLSVITSGDVQVDIDYVRDQGKVVEDIISFGGDIPHSPVLTLITNLKYEENK